MLEPAHAADRAVDEGVGRHGCERPARDAPTGSASACAAVLGQRAHDVALGDDAGLAAGSRRPAAPAKRTNSEEICSRAIVPGASASADVRRR